MKEEVTQRECGSNLGVNSWIFLFLGVRELLDMVHSLDLLDYEMVNGECIEEESTS